VVGHHVERARHIVEMQDVLDLVGKGGALSRDEQDSQQRRQDAGAR
jgi:hypothetical protein